MLLPTLKIEGWGTQNRLQEQSVPKSELFPDLQELDAHGRRHVEHRADWREVACLGEGAAILVNPEYNNVVRVLIGNEEERAGGIDREAARGLALRGSDFDKRKRALLGSIVKVAMLLLSPRFETYRNLPEGCTSISASSIFPLKSLGRVEIVCNGWSAPAPASFENTVTVPFISLIT